jgi:hypothetical protein
VKRALGFHGMLAVAALTGGCGGLLAIEVTETSSEGDASTSASSDVRDAGTPLRSPPRDLPAPNKPPVADCSNVSGHWSGTWHAASGVSGTWETDWVESPSGHLAGKETVTGTSCGTSAELVGQRDGCSITFGLAEFGACSVDFAGTLDGDELSGTFTVTAGLNDRGKFRGSRGP